MDTDIEQIRINTYKASNDVTKNLYGDMELGEALGGISERFHFDKNTQRIFIDVIGDAILGLFPKEHIEKQLIEQIHLPASTAGGIVKELGGFIARITTQKPDGAVVAVQKADTNDSPAIEKTPQASPLGEARPLTREELMQKLSPRRTMVADVASVQHPPVSQPAGTPAQGYEAYQNTKGPGMGR